MGQAPQWVTLEDGSVATRDFTAERGGGLNHTAGWPIECIGSGVNAEQAGELRDHFKKHGVDCEVSRDGNPIYRDANHRRKCLKLRGFSDKAAYC